MVMLSLYAGWALTAGLLLGLLLYQRRFYENRLKRAYEEIVMLRLKLEHQPAQAVPAFTELPADPDYSTVPVRLEGQGYACPVQDHLWTPVTVRAVDEYDSADRKGIVEAIDYCPRCAWRRVRRLV